jgi:hypothetical protein
VPQHIYQVRLRARRVVVAAPPPRTLPPSRRPCTARRAGSPPPAPATPGRACRAPAGRGRLERGRNCSGT